MAAYVGIDIGRAFHAYAIVTGEGQLLATGRVNSDGAGLASLLQVLQRQEVALVGMEATGHYWRNLFHALRRQGYASCVLNPVVTQYYRRMSLTRHKTDDLDAVCIARYLAAVRPQGQQLDPEAQEQLRSLARTQVAVAEQLTAAVNRLHHLVDQTFPEFTHHVPQLRSAKALALLQRYPTAASFCRARGLAKLRYGQRGHSLGEERARQLKAAAAATAGCTQSPAHALLVRQVVAQILLLKNHWCQV